jgi:hypothetical protein
MKKRELLIKKRFDTQTGIWKLKEEYLNSIYVDRIIDLLQKNDCIIGGFSNIAGGGITFFTKDDRKNCVWICVEATRKQSWAEVSYPDWKRVFVKLEEFFKI